MYTLQGQEVFKTVFSFSRNSVLIIIKYLEKKIIRLRERERQIREESEIDSSKNGEKVYYDEKTTLNISTFNQIIKFSYLNP